MRIQQSVPQDCKYSLKVMSSHMINESILYLCGSTKSQLYSPSAIGELPTEEMGGAGGGPRAQGWVPRQAGEKPEARAPLLSSPLCELVGSSPGYTSRNTSVPARLQRPPAGIRLAYCVSPASSGKPFTSQPVGSPAGWQQCSLTQNN